MKLISFNVNGIRAILKKGFDETFSSFDADIFFIQETKFTENGKDPFPFWKEGYHLYQRVSQVRKGYSGVAVLSKKEPLAVHYGLKRLPFREQYEADLLLYLQELDAKKPVIYAGDLNVAHEEIDIKNPASNHNNAGFTDEERGWFGNLLSHGFVDTFRALYPDQVTYSWWSYRFHARENNAGWRIDYFLVSSRLFPKVKDSRIHTEVMGSDHCPIELDLDL